MIESKYNLFSQATQLLDPYSRQARLYPALIVILPVALLIVVWFPALWSTWGALVSLASCFGLVLLLSQIARDRGKRREAELYSAWGGKPPVALLRHPDRRIDDHTKARYRAFLKDQLPQLVLPTGQEERANHEGGRWDVRIGDDLAPYQNARHQNILDTLSREYLVRVPPEPLGAQASRRCNCASCGLHEHRCHHLSILQRPHSADAGSCCGDYSCMDSVNLLDCHGHPVVGPTSCRCVRHPTLSRMRHAEFVE
jgi:hypothetical protein